MTEPLSGKALAAGTPSSSERNDPITLFITWTTYGTWLPGDSRSWRKRKKGEQQPQPLLEDWCRDRMKDKPLFLNKTQRVEVERVIRAHASIRGWELHAVSARSNHVHVAVTAVAPPKRVRDQFKANATGALRRLSDAVRHEKVWTKGGDIEFIDSDDELEQVVIYITDVQDRMEHGK
jgi:REP element-mobilizing transposase RayT